MNKLTIFLYSVAAYAVGMGGLTYFILFVGGWDFLPLHINSQVPEAGGAAVALLVNVLLISAFALQHSLMARSGFKAWMTRIVPASAERSTYVWVSGVAMLAICYFWQPLAGTLWRVEAQPFVALLIAGYVVGWLIAVSASFMVDHFELFGLQQGYYQWVGKTPPVHPLMERGLYKYVRHPIQTGVLIGVWFTPYMSMTQASLAVLMTVYIFIGLYFEERDLVRHLGVSYQEYMSRVPKLVPFMRGKRQE